MIIDLKELCAKYNFIPKGIIHAGAHLAEEQGIYNELGVKKVIWIEAIKELADNLEEKFKDNKDINVKLLKRITKLRNSLKPLLVLCGVRRCCVCGKLSRHKHLSILGQIPFYVCKKHYKETSPALGYCDKIKMKRMGLQNNKGEWVDFINNA